MIVCICNCVDEEKIVKTIKNNNIKNIEDLQEKIKICDNCCTCKRYIENIIELFKK